jgi:peptidyl-prolyl cis-trans isomerase SurA
MTRTISAIVIAIFSAVIFTSATHAQPQRPSRVSLLDRIVAVVNDEVITRRDLDERLKVTMNQLRQQGAAAPSVDELEKQVLERMIFNQVQVQYARENGLRIDDATLEKAIARIAEENKISIATLRSTLEKDGISFNKFREEIRGEIVMVRLREREVDNKIQISEGEVDSFLTSAQGQESAAESFNLSHILITVPERASPEQLQQRRVRAERALAQIKEGVDFRLVAASFSDAPDAEKGGVLGWRELAQLPAIFADAVKDLQAGQISGILRSPNGLHILRVNERQGQNGPMIVAQSHARHILIKTSELVSENEAKDRVVKLKERLDNNADFAELARLQSEDGSASRGGDLGWLSPGDTVPEFEKAMDALKPMQISEPVRSPFGWHLIQVLERRNQDLSQQQLRLRARQALRAQKSDEAYQEWLRQLRDKAFVEYRLEEK